MDAERFRKLGFPADGIITTGNIKLDVTIPMMGEAEKTALRRELGFGDEPVLLCSSTWPGEEAALIAAYKGLRAEGLSARLLIVPRHAERRAEVETLLKASGLSYHFRSRGAATSSVEVAVGDTTGELRRLTQLATVVFVGKSLPPHHEGQTPVEAAVLGKPVVFGSALTNFKAIARELVRTGAARSVADGAGLTATVRELWSDKSARGRMAEAAQAWHRANQGAVNRTLAVLRTELSR
jgi:3-deoxy-D-manno-octulosonic-acid transferase